MSTFSLWQNVKQRRQSMAMEDTTNVSLWILEVGMMIIITIIVSSLQHQTILNYQPFPRDLFYWLERK